MIEINNVVIELSNFVISQNSLFSLKLKLDIVRLISIRKNLVFRYNRQAGVAGVAQVYIISYSRCLPALGINYDF